MLTENSRPRRDDYSANSRNLAEAVPHSFLLSTRSFMPLEISASSKHAELPPNQSIGVIVSTYNSHITEKLCEGAIATLTAGGISEDRIVVVRVPGAWELPFAVQRLIAIRNFAGAIALGAVIKGETSIVSYETKFTLAINDYSAINREIALCSLSMGWRWRRPPGQGNSCDYRCYANVLILEH